jgi:modulator of FtsH protease
MEPVITRTAQTFEAARDTNRVVRQTYTLLSMVLAVAAGGAGIGLAIGLPLTLGVLITFLVVFIGGSFALHALRNSQASIGLTFAWGGIVGFLLSPIVGGYLSLAGGPSIVLNALVTTAVLFFGLSMYAWNSRKDFSFMGGFLFAGLIVLLLAIVANLFLQIPLLSLTISACAVLLMCGLILFDTSRMIHGGETNPVVLTVSLFGSIAVMFLHLLRLFAAFAGED